MLHVNQLIPINNERRSHSHIHMIPRSCVVVTIGRIEHEKARQKRRERARGNQVEVMTYENDLVTNCFRNHFNAKQVDIVVE